MVSVPLYRGPHCFTFSVHAYIEFGWMWLGVSTQAHVSYCTVFAELVTLVVLTESNPIGS
jgi:hypothetical protein